MNDVIKLDDWQKECVAKAFGVDAPESLFDEIMQYGGGLELNEEEIKALLSLVGYRLTAKGGEFADTQSGNGYIERTYTRCVRMPIRSSNNNHGVVLILHLRQVEYLYCCEGENRSADTQSPCPVEIESASIKTFQEA